MAAYSCPKCGKPCAELLDLSCGQKLCKNCTEFVASPQEPCGLYSCLRCLKFFEEKQVQADGPAINQELMECAQLKQIPCTYSQASFGAASLMEHPNKPGQIVGEPKSSLEDRKCPIHGENLTHYCIEDSVRVCKSCRMVGDHQGHKMKTLKGYVEKKKKTLKLFLEKLKAEQKKLEEQEQDYEGIIEEMVTDWIADLRQILEHLDKETRTKAFYELKTQWATITRQIDDVTGLCVLKDPLTFLTKEQEMNMALTSQKNGKTFDRTEISQILRCQALNFAECLTKRTLGDLPRMKKSEIRLDMNTANNNILITQQGRAASYSQRRQLRKSISERFRSRQVLSKCCFSSGSHYWEVAVKGKQCSIGVAYSTIKRKIIRNALIGCNKRSWALHMGDVLSVSHNNVKTEISTDSPVRTFGIYLEYDDGRLSFYQLCNPIRHLHTFTTTFTKDLHAAFYLDVGARVKVCN